MDDQIRSWQIRSWIKATNISDRGGHFVNNVRYRRNLIVFDSYLDALTYAQSYFTGPASFFIHGYKWPWHTKPNYQGILIPTNATPYRKKNA